MGRRSRNGLRTAWLGLAVFVIAVVWAIAQLAGAR